MFANRKPTPKSQIVCKIFECWSPVVICWSCLMEQYSTDKTQEILKWLTLVWTKNMIGFLLLKLNVTKVFIIYLHKKILWMWYQKCISFWKICTMIYEKYRKFIMWKFFLVILTRISHDIFMYLVYDEDFLFNYPNV